MLNRRSLLSRTRNAALAALAAPAVVAGFASQFARAQETETDAEPKPKPDTKPEPDAEPASPQASRGFAAMPLDNPPYGAPPLTFGRRSGITVTVKTDSELVRSLVPAPLEPTGSELMIQQHQNTIVAPLRVHYPNATVIVPVSFNGSEGFYMARVYEGSADATRLSIWGREIWGFPKIAAETEVWREKNRTKSFIRANHAWASVELELGEEALEEPAGSLKLYCHKIIPSCDGQGLDVDRLIEVPWRHTAEMRIPGRVQSFHMHLDLGGKPVKLEVSEFLDAFWFTQVAGTILDKGTVVHDYLAQES